MIFIFNHLQSQDNEIGLFFGGTNYIGDVGPTTFINPFSKDNISGDRQDMSKGVFGIIYRKNLSNRFAIRLGFNYAEIQSSDFWKGSANYRVERGKYFKNNLNEFYIGLDFNFLEFETNLASFGPDFEKLSIDLKSAPSICAIFKIQTAKFRHSI